jgi:hypothetical protein
MRDRTSVFFTDRAGRAGTVLRALAAFAMALALPTAAHAQYNAPPLTSTAIGEEYHVEVAGSLWNPAPVGRVSSEQFGQVGTDLDFVSDLGFEQTRFKDLRIVLRPARKHRFRMEYTPITYLADSVLKRTVTFNGISFPASLPVTSGFDWKVWRFMYEYDLVYRSRGFVGALIDARYTRFVASLEGPGRSEFTSAKVPLPAIGVVGRAYVVPNVALNFEVSGFKLPDFDAKYRANYFDWDIHGTFNVTRYAGVEVGWRRMTTFLHIERDEGDFKFQGLWFGGALRY